MRRRGLIDIPAMIVGHACGGLTCFRVRQPLNSSRSCMLIVSSKENLFYSCRSLMSVLFGLFGMVKDGSGLGHYASLLVFLFIFQSKIRQARDAQKWSSPCKEIHVGIFRAHGLRMECVAPGI